MGKNLYLLLSMVAIMVLVVSLVFIIWRIFSPLPGVTAVPKSAYIGIALLLTAFLCLVLGLLLLFTPYN